MYPTVRSGLSAAGGRLKRQRTPAAIVSWHKSHERADVTIGASFAFFIHMWVPSLQIRITVWFIAMYPPVGNTAFKLSAVDATGPHLSNPYVLLPLIGPRYKDNQHVWVFGAKLANLGMDRDCAKRPCCPC